MLFRSKAKSGTDLQDKPRTRGGLRSMVRGTFSGIGWLYNWLRGRRAYRDFDTRPFEGPDEVDRRERLRKAIKAIRDAGFYTYDGIVSLAQEHYAKRRDEQRQILMNVSRLLREAKTPEERARLQQKRQEAAEMFGERVRDVSRLKSFPLDNSLANDLRELADPADEAIYARVPRGKRLRLMYDFFEDSGLLASPIPAKWLANRPDVTQTLLYRAAGPGDAFYHALRVSTGQDDPIKAFVEDEQKKKQPFAGAVYQSFVFDNPYFKRGVFIVRDGDQRRPVEVEYFEGWSSDLAAGQSRFTQRYEEYYRGYLLDQGYDAYIFLFGPQDPSLKFNDPYSAQLAFRALEHIIQKWTWNSQGETIAEFLRRLDGDEVTHFLEGFVQNSEDVARQASANGANGGMETLPALADFTGRASMEAIFNDPLLKGLPMVPDESEKGRDFKAEALELKSALWKLFEVDGKPGPQIGQNRRVRTLYLEGASRAALTPNILRGAVVAFDNMAKSEMLLERTIMYRLGMPTSNPVDLARLSIVARNRSNRFDMRVPDHDRGKLEVFEPNYREIFLALGYDVAPSDEERRAFRIEPVVNNTTSDAEDMEFIIE